jgi:spore germination protein YaaH
VTRRLTIAILAALLVTSSLAPGVALANEPRREDGSVLTASGRLLPPLPAQLQLPSIHAEMLAGEGSGTFSFEPGGPPTVLLDARGAPMLAGDDGTAAGGIDGSVASQAAPLTAAGLPNGLRKQILGFLPYWMLTDSALDHLNYQLLSTIAYFSVNLRADGYLRKGTSTGWTGWNSAHMTEVLDRAHANGVKVVLTVTHMAWNGDYSDMTALLTSATRRNRAVDEIVAAVVARGADGVNLDFEPVPTSLREEYVAFVRQLKAGLSAAGHGDDLTVCVMAGAATWATGYDVAGLTAAGAADALFVMGYDYHWSGSSRAGGVAPIDSPYTIDVDGTMRDFLAETSGSKIIWGVPYYGRIWPTATRNLNSATLGYGSKAYTYVGHRNEASRFGRRWDDVGKVPWYRYRDGAGTWFQGYYDDTHSLGLKYDLVNARGLAGTGMWTLLMDQGRNELWRLLANRFVNDTAAPVGGIRLLPGTVDGMAVEVRWRVEDYASGMRRHNVQYRPAGGAWVDWLTRTRATSAWFSGELDTRYEFRVQGIDRKGNRQPWITVPPRPAAVEAGAFAEVLISRLNVRSGPGTGYPVVADQPSGAPVYVLEGPVSANGYQWFRVQYAFGEWPSADYARIGWMALGSGTEDYLGPAAAPTITRLSPFVRDVTATGLLSPNGDGRSDSASVGFRLLGPATSARLDVLDAGGDVVRSVDLGALGPGVHEATWDGRLADGSRAPEGRYLPRIAAVDADGTHYGPSVGVGPALLRAYGMRVDLTRPDVESGSPPGGSALVAASRTVRIAFDEAVHAAHAGNVFLESSGGTPIPATNHLRNGRTLLVIEPSSPLPVDQPVTVRVTSRVRDAAGNSAWARTWTFSTAPGTAYDPARTLHLVTGTHAGYRVGADGQLTGEKRLRLRSGGTAPTGHRATLPNLPGRWLFAADGPFAGTWLRESPRAHLRGVTERLGWDPQVAIVVRAGTHIAFRFGGDGQVIARRTRSFAGTIEQRVDERRVVNGRAYLRVAAGRWYRYLLPESALVFVPGMVDRMTFSAGPAVVFEGGRVTGFRYASDGRAVSRLRLRVAAGTTAHASGWAVINGVPHLRLADGPLADRWVREGDLRVTD